MAGYVTNYAGNISFVTVHGSGHMVPMLRPQAALHLFQRVLSGKLLAPLLDMAVLADSTDEEFFGSGYMRRWVRLAQSRHYTDPHPSDASGASNKAAISSS